jgi:uncharacterized protein (DUF305 family)
MGNYIIRYSNLDITYVLKSIIIVRLYMISSIILLAVLSLSIGYTYYNSMIKHNKHEEEDNRYTEIQNDNDFLQFMIPHHQAGIDICKDYLKKTLDPNITYICERVIWLLGYEIFIMKNTINKLQMSFDPIIGNNNYLNTVFKFYEPQVDNPKLANISISSLSNNTSIGDNEFMQKLIMHHQISISTARSIMKYTYQGIIIDIASDIIKEEEKLVSQMQHTISSKTVFRYDSILLK